jgi:nucleoside-triphosphatase THEP1
MKEYLKKPLSEKWMKAAVVGSLWATVEIILGSLLHNLRVPLAGSILSFITVYLVVSFFQVWKVNGLIWRAGLICALMKSISPSAFILGPMIGIFSQAVILDFIIRILGKNSLSYMVGGAFAVFSAWAQLVISLIIIYGWNFALLFENIYAFFVQQFGSGKDPNPVHFLTAISLIYLTSGAIAGLLGSLSGKRFLRDKNFINLSNPLDAHGQSNLFGHTRKKDHSLVVLLFSLVALFIGMILITKFSLWISFPFVVIFIAISYMFYPDNMRYLRKHVFWIQLCIIVLLSAIFKNGFEQFLSVEGFQIGLKICLRALLILGSFSIISVELKNPIIKNILYSKGFRNLYQAVELAFSALPGIMNEFYSQSQNLKGFRRLTFTMLNRSQTLLDSFMEIEKSRKPVFIISGEINQGKTSLTRDVVAELIKKGLRVNGFLTIGNTNDTSRNSYYIRDINTGFEENLCSTKIDKQKPNFGRFYFEEKAIQAGRKIIEQSLTTPTDLLVIDELGPMEINNKGWAPAIEKVVKQNAVAQLWVVRKKLVNPIMRKWNIGNVIVFELGTDSAEYIAENIQNYLSDNQ